MMSTLKLPDLNLKDLNKMACGGPGDGKREYWTLLLFTFYILPSSFFLPGSSGLGSASSIQAAVRQLEAEADAIIQMVREGQRARRQQQAATVSMMPVAPHSFCLSPLLHHIISGVSVPLPCMLLH